jgi:hypothetical protein
MLGCSENSMWRRQHQEGPIDDKWTSLCLDEDEITGDLRIVEIRKEWYLGSSSSQLTSYTTEIVFPEVFLNEDELESENLGLHSHDLSLLLDKPIRRLLRLDDNPHYIRPPPRQPQNTYPINSGSYKPTLTLALVKSPIHYSVTLVSTYLELVDELDLIDW